METVYKPNFLEGKVALMTGGRGGIMYGIAKSLLQHGATVCIMSRNEAQILKAVEQLKIDSKSDKCHGLKCDVRYYQDVDKAVENAVSKLGRIDILFNGAAGNFLAPLDKLSANAFKRVLEIDTMGTFNVTKAVYSRYMKEKGGSIINISASLHYCGTLMQSHAGAAKAAVDALTKHFAVELGPRKIRVNGISPGFIAGTEGFDRLAGGSDMKEVETMIPLQRNGSVEDIANAALFLAGNASSYVTGHTMVVDGGQWLTLANFPLGIKEVRNLWSQAKL
jgi:peroxisomal 2,4-dienoyl-CoA reductase